MVETRGSSQPSPSNENSLATQVYEQIKKKILNLHYPPGSFLTEAKLAKEYGVSRMPIRIAIQKLSYEGWLIADFRRKLKVKGVTKKDIEDIYQFREIIETRALQIIFEKDMTWDYSFLVEEKLLRLRAAYGDYRAFLRADVEMHHAFIGVLENDRISQMYDVICDELYRFSLYLYQIVGSDQNYFDTIIDGVAKTVEGIRDKDYDKAYYYLKRDHFSHEVDGVLVSDIVEKVIPEGGTETLSS